VYFLSKIKLSKIRRPCERRPVWCFVVSRNSKHGQLQNFWMYPKYSVKIVSNFLQNTRSNSNFNRIYNYGMQGLSRKAGRKMLVNLTTLVSYRVSITRHHCISWHVTFENDNFSTWHWIKLNGIVVTFFFISFKRNSFCPMKKQTSRQFHQRKTRAFFVRTSFWQLFSRYMYAVKALKSIIRN